jgi:hypothetical protein
LFILIIVERKRICFPRAALADTSDHFGALHVLQQQASANLAKDAISLESTGSIPYLQVARGQCPG